MTNTEQPEEKSWCEEILLSVSITVIAAAIAYAVVFLPEIRAYFLGLIK